MQVTERMSKHHVESSQIQDLTHVVAAMRQGLYLPPCSTWNEGGCGEPDGGHAPKVEA